MKLSAIPSWHEYRQGLVCELGHLLKTQTCSQWWNMCSAHAAEPRPLRFVKVGGQRRREAVPYGTDQGGIHFDTASPS